MAEKKKLDEQPDEITEQVDETAEASAEKSLEEQMKEAVDVQVEELDPLRRKLTISVPREFINERIDTQYTELRRDATVPGFRKGRAPRRLLEKRFGGDVKNTLTQQLIGTGYMAATEKLELKTIGDPLIWVKNKQGEGETLVDVQKAIEEIELPDEGLLTFACEVEIRPEFNLPTVDGIQLKKPDLKVTDADVENELERFRKMAGVFEAAPDGVVQADDLLTVDMVITVGETVLKDEKGVRVPARGTWIESVKFEDFGDQMKGTKVGDVKTLTGTLGDDYAQADLRGKSAEFKITINAIERMKLPELAVVVNNFGFDSEQELRDWVRRELENRQEEMAKRDLRNQVRDYLVKSVDFPLPSRLSERQINRVVVQSMLELYRQGMPPAETEKKMDELKTSAREQVNHDLKLAFVMQKLADEMETEVSEAEMNAEIAAIAQYQNQRFDRVRDELAKRDALSDLYIGIRNQKIVDALIEKANVA